MVHLSLALRMLRLSLDLHLRAVSAPWRRKHDEPIAGGAAGAGLRVVLKILVGQLANEGGGRGRGASTVLHGHVGGGGGWDSGSISSSMID